LSFNRLDDRNVQLMAVELRDDLGRLLELLLLFFRLDPGSAFFSLRYLLLGRTRLLQIRDQAFKDS
jgi:hypothetical protein